MIKELCEKIGFSADDGNFFEECLAKVLADKECTSKFFDAHDDYFGNGEIYFDTLGEIAEKLSIHRFSLDMTFLLYCARTLHCIYKNRGYDDEMFYDTVHDLWCKNNECKEVFGIRGTFVFKRWFRRFFLNTLFSFGRLEIGAVSFPREQFKEIKQGDRVFDCHIPSGGRLPIEEVYASLKKAYAFFKKEGVLKDDIMIVTCHSWILYPETVKVFGENTNLRKFAELFEIVFSAEDPENDNFWRIFGVEYKNIDKAPQDSSLRRNLVAYLKNGGNLGDAYGVLRFDGEKIVGID